MNSVFKLLFLSLIFSLPSKAEFCREFTTKGKTIRMYSPNAEKERKLVLAIKDRTVSNLETVFDCKKSADRLRCRSKDNGAFHYQENENKLIIMYLSFGSESGKYVEISPEIITNISICK